ncbi:MAG TPA: GntR family transcriptional regulator [Candidatus Acidoferrum sp.]|nr:GntR family transcriptional regulator [Candidatus Acidoferrum sp.]
MPPVGPAKRTTSPKPEHATEDRPGLRVVDAVRPITLVDQLVEALVRAAAEGRILPGERLVEATLSRRFNVSRVPVREALRLLESQGIVTNAPYRGMRLMEVDSRHLRQILVVRASLERVAARDAVAAYRRDPGVLAAMERALGAMERAAAADDSFALAEADTAFHRALCRIGGNDVLLQVWETLARRLTIIVGLSALQKDLKDIYREHVAFLAVLKRANLAAVDKAVDEHIVQHTEMVDFEGWLASQRAARRT